MVGVDLPRRSDMNLSVGPRLGVSQYSKSVHERLVHSAGCGKGLFHGHFLHRRSDRWVVVDVGQLVLPRTIDVQMLDDVGHQRRQACPRSCPVIE